ncbi:MAG: MetQ/NlpA family ABC transporter substrate-binding protein [Succinatimonas sp.]|nr:MetQ/NlpA family ABC transporter substrate-binding protein [Succinatimonas sp.]
MNITVKLGLFRNEDRRPWDCVKKILKDQNINLEIQMFYSRDVLNLALNAGMIDMNAYQTAEDLNRENHEHGYDLVVLAPIFIELMGLFSKKIKPECELPEQSLLMLPQDPFELARALGILKVYDLIKLREVPPAHVQISDIISNPLHLRFDTCDSENAAKMLDDADVAAVFLNGNTAAEQRKLYNLKCICSERKNIEQIPDYPFVKVLAVRRKDFHDPAYAELLHAFRSEETQNLIGKLQLGVGIQSFY